MNPQKKEKKIELQFQHRLIILVYLPQKEGYYKNIFDVFKLCLESAITTINSSCAITVVNNASCKEVVDFINDKYQNNEINAVIHHNENIGKMDAIVGAARASREPLITISDVDILFKFGWQQEVEKNFNFFKNVGSVSPIAVKSTYRYANSSTLAKIITKKLKFVLEAIPENVEDYNLYLKSLNWDKECKKEELWPIVESKNHKAILGSAHQILTINREIFFENVPKKPSLTLIGQNSVYNYCDGPIDFSGGLRLSTFNNYAYHMGNNVEEWMTNVQKSNVLKSKNLEKSIVNLSLNFKPKRNNSFVFKYKEKLVVKLFDLIYTRSIKNNM